MYKKTLLIVLLSFLIKDIRAFKYKRGKNVVVSNYDYCATIGLDLIKKGGNGFDAAIAIMLCEGITKPQDAGLGGGFMGLIKQLGKRTIYINSREVAPLNISLESYNHKTSNKIFGKTVGVPSALKGYGYLKRFSKLSWKQICEPIINMSRIGFPVVIGEILNKKQYEYFEETNRHVFINPKTQMPYQNNETWKRPDLAKTLSDISKYGASLFYSDLYRYKDTIKKEINALGGGITDRDFDMVKVKINRPLKSYFVFNNRKILLQTTPLPGGGISVEFILRIMEKYYKDKYNGRSINKKQCKITNEMYYVLTESFKFAFAFRNELGDPRFNNMTKTVQRLRSSNTINRIYKKIMSSKKTSNNLNYYYMKSEPYFDGGTANIIVRTPKEIIVLTSSINLRFGSWIMSKYGFIYNNQLSDFSLPDRADAGHLKSSTGFNYPEPLKYPVSSMAPSILSVYSNKLNKYIPKYVIGAAGGPKIITAIAQVLNTIFACNVNIVDAIKLPRMHHQLIPNYVIMEKSFLNYHKNFIQRYKYEVDPIFMRGDYSAVTGLEIHNKTYMSATDDPRRPGGALIF